MVRLVLGPRRRNVLLHLEVYIFIADDEPQPSTSRASTGQTSTSNGDANQTSQSSTSTEDANQFNVVHVDPSHLNVYSESVRKSYEKSVELLKKSLPEDMRDSTRVKSVYVVENKNLENNLKEESDEDPEGYFYAYHAAPCPEVIGKVLKTNLKMKFVRNHIYGKGIYFVDKPDLSAENGVLLCRVVRGQQFESAVLNQDIPPGHNSKIVRSDALGCGDITIVQESARILPCFVIHLEPPAVKAASSLATRGKG